MVFPERPSSRTGLFDKISLPHSSRASRISSVCYANGFFPCSRNHTFLLMNPLRQATRTLQELRNRATSRQMETKLFMFSQSYKQFHASHWEEESTRMGGVALSWAGGCWCWDGELKEKGTADIGREWEWEGQDVKDGEMGGVEVKVNKRARNAEEEILPRAL
ncbi:hypothetical protein D9757_010547 [Collybiopsis confluens]|uniref:Uncharacterized protein n=1 Tax=Collybiopsis confluens TaxID=2823264 RepID=A0A8H5GY50_9AGAR|nr:hypothetical protein D9757_010547 [Collybiopsis confluens]